MRTFQRLVHRARAHPRDRGAIAVLMGMIAFVLFGMVGLSVDLGRLYAMRAKLSRAADAAVLSGVVEFPDVNKATLVANNYLAANEPSAVGTVTADTSVNKLTVEARKTVNFSFIRVFGINQGTVKARAAAGFEVAPLDAVMVIDATGSMGSGSGCPNGDTCPIVAAKNAAKNFVNLLLGYGSQITQVGATPFRGCFNPPKTTAGCVPSSMVSGLTSSRTTITAGVDTIGSQGGTGTNVCLGLLKGQSILFGTGAQTTSDTRHVIVLLSDGDNNYQGEDVYSSGSPGSPDAACRPSSNLNKDEDPSSSCRSTETNEAVLDTKTRTLSSTIKSTQKAEIYVVGFGVCGSASSSLCIPSRIGNKSYHDNVADENLLKCIASSRPGTNDHYYRASSASELPQIFTAIGQSVGSGLVE